MTTGRAVLCAGRVASCDSARAGVGVIEQGAVLIERGRVVMVGERSEVLAAAGGAPVLLDAPDALMTPGLIDAHTHAAWAGSRHDEYAVRLAGGDYEAIAKAGGGIRATQRAVAAQSTEQLAEGLRARLLRMAAMGVTSVEVKSGYGLEGPEERKQLEAIARAASDVGLPRVVPTYLALHALPSSWASRRAAYVERVADDWLRGFARDGLCRYVDAYVDRAAFTVDEARVVLERARGFGLGVRLHAGQFADVGACELAAQLGAASADHLEHVGERGLEAMARAGTAAVLLPVASWTLAQPPPPVEAMRKHGVSLVVASDANPGTAPTESLPLALAMAARSYGLSPTECLLGATRHAARSLGLDGVAGELKAGASADLVVWDLPHESALVQPWGAPPVRLVMARGSTLLRSTTPG